MALFFGLFVGTKPNPRVSQPRVRPRGLWSPRVCSLWYLWGHNPAVTWEKGDLIHVLFHCPPCELLDSHLKLFACPYLLCHIYLYMYNTVTQKTLFQKVICLLHTIEGWIWETKGHLVLCSFSSWANRFKFQFRFQYKWKQNNLEKVGFFFPWVSCTAMRFSSDSGFPDSVKTLKKLTEAVCVSGSLSVSQAFSNTWQRYSAWVLCRLNRGCCCRPFALNRHLVMEAGRLGLEVAFMRLYMRL